jgi:septal ring factor EnvC (AmiA/AmiB activator)
MENEPVDEADLRTLVRAFRTSVSEEQAAIHRQMSDLATEVRQRLTTVETAMLNGLRDLSQRSDRRFTELERDVADVKQDVAEVKQEVAGVKQEVAGVKQEVAQLAEGLRDVALAVGRIEDMLTR